MKNTLVTILALSMCLAGCGGAQASIAHPVSTSSPLSTPETDTLTLFMTGDALLHDPVSYAGINSDGSYDYSRVVGSVGALAEKYDLAYYNQETILGGDEFGIHGYPCFNAPQAFGTEMVNEGFNLVSTANNHSLDMGAQGVINSVNFWNSQPGVVMSGTYLSQEEKDAVRVHEMNNITYTFFSYTYGCNGLTAPEGMEYLVADYGADGTEEMLDQVRRADPLCDVVIVAMHWGTEYVMDPTEEQLSLAQQLSDAGADIIIGNHPHVINPIARVNNTLVFYALGNMVSSQLEEENLIGMAAACTIVKTTENGSSSIEINDVKADLLYTVDPAGAVHVVPFAQLTDAELPNHEEVYQRYIPYLTSMDAEVQVGGL